MRKKMFTTSSFFILFLLSTSASAGIEDLFLGIEPSEPNNGLVLEIALPKQEYFFFEPVTVYTRFINKTDNPIALVLGRNCFTEINTKMNWKSSSIDDKVHPPITNAQYKNMFIIPGHGYAYFALPDKMFLAGKEKINIEYKHSQDYDQPPLEGVEVWQGTVKSNELIVSSLDKETLTPEEKKKIEEKIKRHIQLFKRDDTPTTYSAMTHLLMLSRYSVPILIENIKNTDSQIRLYSIETLGSLANKTLCEAKGYERNVSSLDDLLSAYDKEREAYVKEKIIHALYSFNDMETEKHLRIVQTLKKANNEEDKDLRQVGARILLKMSKSDGIPLVIEKMADETYFAERGSASQRVLINALKEVTGQDFGTSSRYWNNWWEKNKDKFTRTK